MAFHYTYNYPQMARDGGFKLRNYKDGPVDWRLIGSIEIERILRDQSFEQIDAVLNHLSEAPLGSILDSRILDSGISKYFMLSQFSVQYLLFCRKFLEETVTDLRESHNNSELELATAKRSLSEARNEVLQLHKKLTQMEAINEVLYPCHLCTKNFVNNDSLNLHISRKHKGIVKPEKQTEITQPLCKERETDLTLINTIKLELEVKHLKERLNNAEREIKEKSLESEIKNMLEKSETKSVHSIGIQSNLSEIKERDDSGGDSESISFQNRQQMTTLQEKLQEFETWKEEQILQNSQFLNNVNSKIQEINSSLEITRNQVEIQIDDARQKPLLSPVEDLDKMLTKKVEELGKITAANIEDIVQKIETNYKEKLEILEKELNKLNQQYILQKDLTSARDSVKVHRVHPKPIEQSDRNPNLCHKALECKSKANEKQEIKATSDSEGNHTFLKDGNAIPHEKDCSKDEESLSTSGINDEDSTDFSASLPDEEILKKTFSVEQDTSKTMTHKKNQQSIRLQQQQAKPKVVTKKKAEKITNKRLSSLGVDTEAKKLSHVLKKRYLGDLNEKRIKLKQKNSQFYATRNKIKKFVDKLCSTKMPSSAEALLKVTEHMDPKDPNFLNDDEHALSQKKEASTLLNEFPLPESNNFSKRLERILASPIRKPVDHLIANITNNDFEHKKPIPMPRKRVMFNQPETQKKYINFS